MPDLLAPRLRPLGLPPVPEGFVVYLDRYRVPTAATYLRRELLDVARANGLGLSPALLRKWAQWDLLPPPTPGGPAARSGPGKGERWSRDAAIRVAWLSYLRASGLPYSALALALWPFGEFDAWPERLRGWLRGFLRWDRRFHEDRISEEAAAEDEEAELVRYEDVVITGMGSLTQRSELLSSAGLPESHPQRPDLVELLGHLNLKELRAMAGGISDSELRVIGKTLRTRRADAPEEFRFMLFDNPVGLARLVVRECMRTSSRSKREPASATKGNS